MTQKPQNFDTPPNSNKVVIKKYANRRLYNTATSKYIVLADVIELVNLGTEFVIEDAKTGADITREILNQIIFEQETRPAEFLFPLEFQKQLIRMYGDAYGKMFPDFLTQSISYFNSERNQMQDMFKGMMGQNTGAFFTQAQEMARKNMEMFQKNWDVFGVMNPAQQDAAEAPSENTDKEDTKSAELDDIQKQIDALQTRLKSIK
jgi:polyhydroxyalkanoate synthesis repressor PhaR